MLHSPQRLQHKASHRSEGQGSNTPAGGSSDLPHMTLSTATIQSSLSSLQQLHTNTSFTCKPLKYCSAVCMCVCARKLTGAECIVARLCLHGAALAPSAPLLWWRVVAETNPRDVAFSTCGCTRRPRRPKAPVPISTC